MIRILPGCSIVFRWFTAVALGAVLPSTANAHVKWFAPYSLDEAPLPIGEVLTPEFIYFYLGSAVFIYAFFWFDRYFYQREDLNQYLAR